MSRSTPGAIAAMVCGGNRWMQNHIFHEGKLKQKICKKNIYKSDQGHRRGFWIRNIFYGFDYDLLRESILFHRFTHIQARFLALKLEIFRFSKEIVQLWASALPI